MHNGMENIKCYGCVESRMYKPHATAPELRFS